MTIPSRGRRAIRIGDAEYAWSIRQKPTYRQGAFGTPMRLAVQRVDPEGHGVLIVSLVVSRPDNWLAPHRTAVTPKLVREIVVRALSTGWHPSLGTTYSIEHPLADRAG